MAKTRPQIDTVEFDPQRHFATVNYRTAKGSFRATGTLLATRFCYLAPKILDEPG